MRHLDLMQLFKSFLFGASYISLFSGRFAPVKSVQCPVSTASMTDKAPESGQSCSQGNYMAGSSSVAFVTTPDQASAKKLAHNLVSNKLAACVNIIPQITSIYEWEGKINEDSEFLMMIKTRTSRVDELTKYVRENHPYSVAEVISLPIENGNPPYLDWIANTVPEKSKK